MRVLVVDQDATLVCLSYFGAMSKPAHVRYLIRRLKRQMPQARFLACFWMLGEMPARLEEWRNAVGADFAAASLQEAAAICARETAAAGGIMAQDAVPATRNAA